ncbi:MAG TPA: MFS transporter, partial [Pilimelia sp.]|nr:MFS transporter [Pilimelia sp.]
LPPRADSDPPETLPRPFSEIGLRRDEKALTGEMVIAALTDSAFLRALYGFLFLFLAFAIKAGDLPTVIFGTDVGDAGALAIVGAALGVGTFLATAAGTRLRIHRPLALQSNGLVIVAGVAVLTTVRFSLPMVALLCLVTAIVSGVSKLAVDATIQERIDERQRASAFAHSETLLMLAFVAGGALGLIPLDGRIGIGVLAAIAGLATLWAVVAAARLRKEKLNGRAAVESERDRKPTKPAQPARPAPSSPPPPPPVVDPADTADDSAAPPGFHIYRPSSAPRGAERGPTG